MLRHRVLFVGLATLDLGYLVERYPAENTKNLADDHFMAAGGPAANAAVAYAFLGGRAHLVAALGRHDLASVVHEELRSRSVEVVDLFPAHQGPPPVSAITICRQTGSRTIVSLDSSRLPAFSELPDGVPGPWDLLLVDGHLPGLAITAARAARAAGVPVVLDGGRWKPALDDLLPHVSIAICSRSFRPPGLEDADATAIHQDLHERGVRLVATTDGSEPVRFSAPDDKGEIAVPAVPALDTLGAGDLFHGAFAYYYLPDRDFPAALEKAAEVASRSCAFFGTRAWMSLGRSAFPA